MTIIILSHVFLFIAGFLFLDIYFGKKSKGYGYATFNTDKSFSIILNNEKIIVPYYFYDHVESGDIFEVQTLKGRYTSINYLAKINKI